MLKSFLKVAKPYWASEKKVRGLLFVMVIVAFVLAQVYLMVALNSWNQKFYDALQNLDAKQFYFQLMMFFVISTGYALSTVFRVYVENLLEIDWREWLTSYWVDQWLRNKVFAHISVSEQAVDNPDQRIAEDIRLIVNKTLQLFFGFLREVLTGASFIFILYSLSGVLKFQFSVGRTNYGVQVYGYLVWICFSYVLVATWITHLIGRRLIHLDRWQQKFEAYFRAALMRTRENALSIAAQSDEKLIEHRLRDEFKKVVSNFVKIAKVRRDLGVFEKTYNQISYMFSFVIVAPKLFLREITLGQLFQINSAFSQVQGSFSYFVTVYHEVAEWSASVKRFVEFTQNIENLNTKAEYRETEFAHGKLALEASTDFTIWVPERHTSPESHRNVRDHRRLLKIKDFAISFGERVLLEGKNGSGKSTFLRSLAGAWPHFDGTLKVNTAARIFFFDQSVFIAETNLLRWFGTQSKHEIISMLSEFDLKHLVSQLEIENDWQQTLSMGEKQKLTWIRLFLSDSNIIILDEATSSLTESDELRFYKQLLERYPDAALLSVSHSSAVAGFHHRIMSIVD